MPEHLFVYGTLTPDLAPAEVKRTLCSLRTLGPATMPGLLYDLGEFPAAIVQPGAQSWIAGQVLVLPDDPSVLAHLDAYEGFDPERPDDSLYLRVRHSALLTTQAAGGASKPRSLACWVYVYNREPRNGVHIPHGDYVRWLAAKRVPAGSA
jgi:gamma-glutamylcyclotransferase (GGCT)/AIG2-like uncharacterized protein YtfP